MDTEQIDIHNLPYKLSYELSAFYADSVGKPLNYQKEHVLLLDWVDAINACEKMAKVLRDRHTMTDMAAFKSEANILLECNSQ